MTVIQSLKKFALSQPDQKVWSFLNDSGDVIDSFTYSELDSSTTELAIQLINTHHLKAGDRALLVFFPGLAFTASLIACFKAGIIAVPVFPPDPRKLQKDLDHFISIQTSSGAKFVLTHSIYNYAKKVTDFQQMFTTKKFLTWPTLQWIIVDDILSKTKVKHSKSSSSSSSSSSSTELLIPDLKTIAFLQYTSGSTSEPKGVMISHANLAHNLSIITKQLAVDTSTINVSWLPQYHDMGLIGSYLGTLCCGGIGYFLSPISFLKDPNIWLKAISRYRGSHTQAPNFAYPLAVRKFNEYNLEHNSQPLIFDLTCIKHMINAAEPVDLTAISEFYDTFTKYGLRSNVVIPTYGLAEHTVFVCSDGKTVLKLNKISLENSVVEVLSQQPLCQSDDLQISNNNNSNNNNNNNNNNNSNNRGEKNENTSDNTREQYLVGCGLYELADAVDIKIVDPETCLQVAENTVGEIWVNSPSKALGYWNQPELTQDAFYATIITATTATDHAAAGHAATATATTASTNTINISSNNSITATATATTTADSNTTTNNSNTNSNTNTTFTTLTTTTTSYLRTGDLGFLFNKELFICGRIKDLIIIRGTNHFPQDIEKTAERSSHLLRAGCSAAFAITHESTHTETVVYVAELKQNVPTKEYESIISSIRNAVNNEHGISLSCICLLQTKTVIKTTSGKITRAGCKIAYTNNKLQILYKWEGGGGGINNSNDNNSNDDDGFGVSSDTATDIISQNNTNTNTATNNTTNNNKQTNASSVPKIPKLSRTELQSMEINELKQLIEVALISVSAQSPSPLVAPLDYNTSVVSLGLDSFSVVQFKGLLEKRFHTDVPDEFLFTSYATINELANTVKNGGLTENQLTQYDAVQPSGNPPADVSGTSGSSGTTGKGNKNVPKSTTVIEQHQPLCPWFTCCY